MTWPRPRGVILALGIALLADGVGCVASEQREAAAARRSHDECVAEHGESARECEAAKERMLERQERYDEHSRRAWGCDPAQEACPTPR